MAEQDLITDLARSAVELIAPEELPTFHILINAYVRDPERALAARNEKRDPLAFDLGALQELVTPAAILMATALAQSLADGLLPPDAVADSRRRLVRWSRRALRRRPVPDPADAAALDQPAAAPDLTDEQLAQVKEGVVRTATAAGVPDVKAQLIADALIGRLISMRGDPES